MTIDGKVVNKSFTVYDSEADTVLELIEDLGEYANSIPYSDHKGSWQGLSRPTLSDEGMRATVEDIIYNKIPVIQTSLDNNKNNINRITNTELNINFFEGNSKEEKLINMINFAIDNNYKKVFVPAGDYDFDGVITDTILLKESFNKIIIEGENPKTTVFKYNHLQDKPLLKVRGGSGQLCKGYIKNITFVGNETTSAIELNHVCGYEIINCIFSTNKIGVLMHNSHSGGFTEFNIVRNCDFYQECNTALEYKVTNGGDRSFHGSGIKDCIINQSNNEVNSKIIIGSGCLPYNAPLDATFFIRCETPLIHNVGYTISNFFGNIRTEQFGTSYKATISNNVIYYVGGVNSLTEISLGNLVLCDRVQLNSDGSSNIIRKPYTVAKTGTGSLNEICHLEGNEVVIVNVCCTAPNWEQTAVYVVGTAPAGNEGVSSKLIQIRNFNVTGWDMGDIIVENGYVKYNNPRIPSESTFDIKATITPIGTRFNYVLN